MQRTPFAGSEKIAPDLLSARDADTPFDVIAQYVPGEDTDDCLATATGIGKECSGNPCTYVVLGVASGVKLIKQFDSPFCRLSIFNASHVLIDENRIPIRIHHDKAGGPRRTLICLSLKLYPLRLQLPL